MFTLLYENSENIEFDVILEMKVIFWKFGNYSSIEN